MDGGLNGTMIAKYNVFENANCGAIAGVHGDWYEGPSGVGNFVNWVWDFNTGYQHQGGGTQGFAYEPCTIDPCAAANLTGESNNNTMVAAGPGGDIVNFFFGIGGVNTYTNTWTFNANYVDPTNGGAGTTGFIRAQATGTHGSGNINMTTGAAAAGSTW